jgi:chemotaxis protein methyltransferase CheR
VAQAHAALRREGDIPLEDGELRRIVQLVYQRAGITLHEGKRPLILARLHRHVSAGGFANFAAYLEHVERDTTGAALTMLLDAIATNHTNFFREEEHFQILQQRVLPPLVAAAAPIRIWSAACSTGEEPVTLAVTLREALPEAALGRVRLVASDLSTKALKVARRGVYRVERLGDVPQPVLRKYFERGLGEQSGLARVAAPVLKMIDYRQANLLDVNLLEQFDVIFCRNVMIYFDRHVQQRVVSALERHLAPGGYLFISHSESLNRITHGLRWTAPAVFRREPR